MHTPDSIGQHWEMAVSNCDHWDNTTHLAQWNKESKLRYPKQIANHWMNRPIGNFHPEGRTLPGNWPIGQNEFTNQKQIQILKTDVLHNLCALPVVAIVGVFEFWYSNLIKMPSPRVQTKPTTVPHGRNYNSICSQAAPSSFSCHNCSAKCAFQITRPIYFYKWYKWHSFTFKYKLIKCLLKDWNQRINVAFVYKRAWKM